METNALLSTTDWKWQGISRVRHPYSSALSKENKISTLNLLSIFIQRANSSQVTLKARLFGITECSSQQESNSVTLWKYINHHQSSSSSSSSSSSIINHQSSIINHHQSSIINHHQSSSIIINHHQSSIIIIIIIIIIISLPRSLFYATHTMWL